VNPAIQGYTAAVLDTLDDDGRAVLETDLAAVDRLFARDAELNAALTDIVVPPAARRAVLSDLLEGKVSPPARRVAAYAAGAVHSQEVPAAISWTAHRLRQVVERQGATEEVGGHREARQRVGGYATEVFEDATVPELEEIEDQLFRFARIVAGTPPLRTVLGDRDLPAEARRGVVDELLSGKVLPATLRLAGYAVTGGRPRDIVGTLDWLVEQTAAARGWRVARVRAGQEVDGDERSKLEGTLSRLAGSPVELQVTVDPVLLAGVEVEIGDLRLDATARGRLDRLREHMTAGGWQDAGFGRVQRAAAMGRTGAARAEAGPGGGSPGSAEGD
jgi:F-type H+-transporting ATPase subunit delta